MILAILGKAIWFVIGIVIGMLGRDQIVLIVKTFLG